MTITTFALPVDIPWRRLCVSDDMIDSDVCDRKFPYRWRSSIAVFGYEPPEDQQTYDDMVVSYLKVACTITSFQPNPEEVGLKNRRFDSYWNVPLVIEDYANKVSRAYPCYGAVLEVAVAPSEKLIDGKPVPLSQYPYFMDFDPKKREVYELVSETGEQMSRSLDEVNVRKGATTTNSREVLDQTAVGLEASAGVSAGFVNVGGKASYTNTNSTKNITQNEVQDFRTTDNAREQRENLSHTTQLTQMYQQLNSYHLGTNRAVFFVLPRPHIIDDKDTPLTFINGPRRLEGIQEFFLVVLRPKAIADVCVEAYLETAHVGEVATYGATTETKTDVTPTLSVAIASNPSNPKAVSTKAGSITYAPPSGWSIDTSKAPGYAINILKQQGMSFCGVTALSASQLVLKGEVKTSYTIDRDDGTFDDDTGRRGPVNKPGPGIPEGRDGYLDANVTVHLARGGRVKTGSANGLYITGRGVCCCQSGEIRHNLRFGRESVVYEAYLSSARRALLGSTARVSAVDANLLRAEIGQVMVNSVGAPDRYARGAIGFAESRLVATSLANLLAGDAAHDTHPANIAGLDASIADRIASRMPHITRSDLMTMSPAEQADRFGLDDEELQHLRRALVGLEGEPSTPVARWDTAGDRDSAARVAVPLVIGLSADEAIEALSGVGLGSATAETIDSLLPAGSVIAQTPSAGEMVTPRSQIALQVASGRCVRLPELVGAGLMEAACRLRDAGLIAEPTVKGSTGRGARVAALDPPAGTLVTPGADVVLNLREAD